MKVINGQKVYPSLDAITEPIDVVTLYVSADILTKIADAIFAKSPQKIIFNPDAENLELERLAF